MGTSLTSNPKTTLIARSSLQPIEVPLPDDDVDAMTAMCLTLHFKNSGQSEKPQVQKVRMLATLADKYDCLEAIKFFAKCWLQGTGINSGSSCADATALVEAAWLLNDSTAFKLATSVLVRKRAPSEAGRVRSQKDNVFPNSIHLQIETQAETGLAKMLRKMKEPSRNMIDGADAYVYPSQEHGTKNGRVYKPGQHDWVRALSYQMIIGPIEMLEAQEKLSINGLLSQYSRIVADEDVLSTDVQSAPPATPAIRGGRGGFGAVNIVRSQATAKQERYPNKIAGCRACQFDLDEHFTAMAALANQEAVGLCLSCTKRGKLICICH